MKYLRKIIVIVASCLMITAGVHHCILPNHILEGGLMGVGLIVYYTLHFHVGIVMLVCSIPIFVLAWSYYKPFLYRSIIGISLLATSIQLYSYVPFEYTLSPYVSTIIGGGLIGVGMGILFRYDMTSDGLDLFAQLLSKYFKIEVGIIIFIIDFVIISAGLFIETAEQMILSFITICMIGIVVTLITGNQYAKMEK